MPAKPNAFQAQRNLMIPGVGSLGDGQRYPEVGFVYETPVLAAMVKNGLLRSRFPIDDDVETTLPSVEVESATPVGEILVIQGPTPNQQPAVAFVPNAPEQAAFVPRYDPPPVLVEVESAGPAPLVIEPTPVEALIAEIAAEEPTAEPAAEPTAEPAAEPAVVLPKKAKASK